MSMNASLAHSRDRVNLVEPGRLHPAVSFARASTATYMGSGGPLKTAAVDQPRYEYDSSGNYLGLLIEEARTNAVLQSQCSTGFAGVGTTPPTIADNISFGGDTCTQIHFDQTMNAGYSGSRAYSKTAQASTAANQLYGASIYIGVSRALTGAEQIIFYFTGAAGSSKYAIDSSNSAPLVGSLSYATVLATVNPNTAGSVYPVVYVGTALAAPLDVFVCRAMVNLGSTTLSAVPYGSYIPTTTAAVTRAADVAQAASLSALGINTTAGTFVINHDAPTGAPLIYSGSNKILDSAGGTKVAIAYDASGTRTSINGAATTTGAALTWSTTLDLLRSATAGANAHVKSLTWYNTKRPGSELQRLTA